MAQDRCRWPALTVALAAQGSTGSLGIGTDRGGAVVSTVSWLLAMDTRAVTMTPWIVTWTMPLPSVMGRSPSAWRTAASVMSALTVPPLIFLIWTRRFSNKALLSSRTPVTV